MSPDMYLCVGDGEDEAPGRWKGVGVNIRPRGRRDRVSGEMEYLKSRREEGATDLLREGTGRRKVCKQIGGG